jgi:hypothetical protein
VTIRLGDERGKKHEQKSNHCPRERHDQPPVEHDRAVEIGDCDEALFDRGHFDENHELLVLLDQSGVRGGGLLYLDDGPVGLHEIENRLLGAGFFGDV